MPPSPIRRLAGRELVSILMHIIGIFHRTLQCRRAAGSGKGRMGSDYSLSIWEARFKVQGGKNEKNEGASCLGVKFEFRMKLCWDPNFSLVNRGPDPSMLLSKLQPTPWCKGQSGVWWKFPKDRPSLYSG